MKFLMNSTKKEGPKIFGVYELFKKIWSAGRGPRCWNESTVILIHKEGHKSKDLRNYRPIALTHNLYDFLWSAK